MNELEKISPGDKSFSNALSHFENIILGYFYFRTKQEVKLVGISEEPYEGLETMLDSEIDAYITPEDRELDTYPNTIKSFGIITNIPPINKAGSHYAFFSNEPDKDAIVRWVTLVRIIDGHLMPSMSLKMAAEAMNRDILVEFDDLVVKYIDLISRDDDSDAIRVPIDPLGRGRILLNHNGPSQTFRHISLAKAYHNNFNKEEKEFLSGSLLLMGATAIGINDQRPNPFDAALDGVENHAAAVDDIISGNFMQRPHDIYTLELFIVLMIGLIFAPILIFTRAIYSGAVGLGFLVGYYYFDKYFWFSNGIWAYIGMPILVIVLLFTTITLLKYITEEKERKK